MSEHVKIPEREVRKRLIIATGILELHRAIKQVNDPARVITLLAVAKGWYEGRPLDVTGISRETSIPRTTVWRHLRDLETSGIVQISRTQRWVYPSSNTMTGATFAHFYVDLELIFTRVGRSLSILDT